MGNKLLHHLLHWVLIIHNHLTQPGVLPVTATHKHKHTFTQSTSHMLEERQKSWEMFEIYVPFHSAIAKTEV